MYEIIEKNKAFGYMYEKYHAEEIVNQVRVVSLKKTVNEFTYIILIDSLGRSIFEAYQYMNNYLDKAEWKKREKAEQALKIFYTFIELFNIIDYKNLSLIDLRKFISFLKGGKSRGNEYIFNISTRRGISTINQYMAVYRDFFLFMNLNDSVFFNKKILGQYVKSSRTSAGAKVSVEKYDSNITNPTTKRVPKYIRPDEYIMVQKYIEKTEKKYKLRDKIIVKLLYEYGLRISEVLGLTLEDIKELDGKYKKRYGKIILRNRISDKEYQRCKNLIMPKDNSEYGLSTYNIKKEGYHEIIVDLQVIHLIREYIDMTRDVFTMSTKAITNVHKAKADIVEVQSDIRENYYIFLSKNYTPITKSGWNDILRDIFIATGLHVDIGVRKDNLNHRFRHGFAMICVKNNVDRYTLKELLRHRKLSSVDIYYNPTTEDNIDMAVEISDIIKRNLGINVQNLIDDIR